tara:strand:+ start:28 stop:1035 length:1008 start_codon:yes stop_codon:yes gene_type:complete
MKNKIKHYVFISSNAIKGGPNSFTKNLIDSFNYLNICEYTNDVFLSDSVLLIGENYRIKDLVLSILFNKRIFYRLDGRRFSFFSSVKFKRSGRKSIIKFLKAIFFELKVLTAYSFANKIIYQSNFTRKQFYLIENFYKKSFKVILNPIGMSEILFKKIDLDIRYSMPKERFVTISKGYIHKSKLLEIAYKVFNKLGIKIYVFGNCNNEIKAQFPLMKFFGYVKSHTYKSYLKKCFTFLCVEDFACCPNALIEAQFMGKPIIGPKNGSLLEMCPNPEIQLLNYDLNIETQLRNLIIDYSKNYDYWVKNSIKFSESKFGVNQYREYCNLFTNNDDNS